MKRFLLLTTTLAALLALSAPAAQAGKTYNGPALDGREVALPAGLSVDGDAEVQLFGTEPAGCPWWGCGVDGSALGGWQVALPELAAPAIDPLRLPGDSRGVLPSDRRWPAAEQDQRAQQ